MSNQYKEIFIRNLIDVGIDYSETENENTVRVSVGNAPIYFSFYDVCEENNEVCCSVRAYSPLRTIEKDEKTYADAIILCNCLNSMYKFVKFSVEEDLTLSASADAYINGESALVICLSIFKKMINVTDDVFSKYF